MGNRSLEFLVVKPEWVVLLGALADVGLVLMARIMWRELRSVGARRAGFALDGATLLVAAAAPLAYLVLGGPWMVAALYVPVTVLYWSPRLVVWITGGPMPLHGLAKERSDLATRWQHIVAAGEMADQDRAWFRTSSKKLERWRTPATSELVDIYQAKIADVLLSLEGDREGLEAREAARNARVG